MLSCVCSRYVPVCPCPVCFPGSLNIIKVYKFEFDSVSPRSVLLAVANRDRCI